jgi:hypothetical protein
MKITAAHAAVTALLLPGRASAPPTWPLPSDALEPEIRIALQGWNDAASRGDLAAFMAPFDDSADILLVGSDKGEVFKGRAQVEGWPVKRGDVWAWRLFNGSVPAGE